MLKLTNLKKRIADIFGSLHLVFEYGKKHIWAIIIFTLLGATGAVVGIFNSLVSRDMVDIITGHKTGELLLTFALLIASQLVVFTLNSISSYVSVIVSLKVENEVKADLYERIMSTEWEELAEFHSGQIVSRWSGDAATVANGILSSVPSLMVCIFRFVSAFILVVTQDASFAIIAIASVPITMAMTKFNLSRLKASGMECMEITAKLSAFSQDSFSNLHNVKALDMVPLYVKRLVVIQKENLNARSKNQKQIFVNSLILTIISLLITYANYGWGVYRVWSGVITYGSMTMFLSLSQSLSGTIQSILGFVPNTVNLSNACKRIDEILKLPKEVYSNVDEVNSFKNEVSCGGIGVKVCNASFTYKNGTEVMENVDFVAQPRSVVGLVGPSGEGKTTMLRLLLALVYPKSGDAVLYGHSGNKGEEITIPIEASSRRLFAYVPQGNSMFSGTIADNMRNVKDDATDEEIIEALKMACAWEFVSKLPDGINSEVKEHGGGFSEGQSQRLSIARALLRKSPILLLDEATSALDLDTEKRVLTNIMADDYPRTCIITTHRPEVMEACDKVYMINEKILCEKRK